MLSCVIQSSVIVVPVGKAAVAKVRTATNLEKTNLPKQ
jgi:hypothetical protein